MCIKKKIINKYTLLFIRKVSYFKDSQLPYPPPEPFLGGGGK